MRVNGHLNERNQMDRKKLTEREHPIAKEAVRMKGTEYKFQNKWVPYWMCKFGKLKISKILNCSVSLVLQELKCYTAVSKLIRGVSFSNHGRAVIVIIWKVYVGANLDADSLH